ncbi:hypothetical protein Asi02nite_77840 [Asanoa siamensis]|uniref:M23ase beta-sheet core domain-containing protein n=2 Tax=Asanoa siamensis TaxID=926357 RepID=A0ABQ4D3Z6_9ACTN|nr:hypothetical protein Asi02nite_77840 [Asanoa siamensis]
MAMAALAAIAISVLDASAAGAAGPRPNFRAPWPCGQQREYYHHATEVNNAIDFNIAGNGDLGTPALASASGTVIEAVRNHPGYGNYVRLSHANGWFSLVAHLDSISVSVGQAVQTGHELGKVGNTGNSSGPHLHYEQEADNIGNNQPIVIDGVALRYNSTPALHRSGNCGGGGFDDIGVYRPAEATFYLKGGPAVHFGNPNFRPLMGDWNGDGLDTPGVFRPDNRTFYLKNSNTSGNADGVYGFGNATDIPVAGDWNGDGTTGFGVFRPSNGTFYLKNQFDNTGVAEITAVFGTDGDIPVAGDWDGNGTDTIGVYRPSERAFYLRNVNSSGASQGRFVYGNPGDKPIVGDWNGDVYDTIGVYRPSNGVFYLKNSNNNDGEADIAVGYGSPGDVPISGSWR